MKLLLNEPQTSARLTATFFAVVESSATYSQQQLTAQVSVCSELCAPPRVLVLEQQTVLPHCCMVLRGLLQFTQIQCLIFRFLHKQEPSTAEKPGTASLIPSQQLFDVLFSLLD